MADQTHLQKLFNDSGFPDFRWVDPKEIVVAQWVRLKCQFGCDSYGRNASCPPNTPPLADCRAFFGEYRLGAVFHVSRRFDDSEERHAWSRTANRALVELEEAVCTANHPKAFMMFLDNCNLCRECANTRSHCRNKKLARPSPEGMGMDVSATVAKYGYTIGTAADHDLEINHFAFLLIE